MRKSGRTRDIQRRLVVTRDPMCGNENLENLESGLKRKEKTSTMHDEYKETSTMHDEHRETSKMHDEHRETSAMCDRHGKMSSACEGKGTDETNMG